MEMTILKEGKNIRLVFSSGKRREEVVGLWRWVYEDFLALFYEVKTRVHADEEVWTWPFDEAALDAFERLRGRRG